MENSKENSENQQLDQEIQGICAWGRGPAAQKPRNPRKLKGKLRKPAAGPRNPRNGGLGCLGFLGPAAGFLGCPSNFSMFS